MYFLTFQMHFARPLFRPSAISCVILFIKVHLALFELLEQKKMKIIFKFVILNNREKIRAKYFAIYKLVHPVYILIDMYIKWLSNIKNSKKKVKYFPSKFLESAKISTHLFSVSFYSTWTFTGCRLDSVSITHFMLNLYNYY